MSRFLRQLVAERCARDPGCAVTVLGDFNAEPGEEVMGPAGLAATLDAEQAQSGAASLFNTVAAAASQIAGRPVTSARELGALTGRLGPHFTTHQRPATGEHVLFDQILVSPSLLGGQGPLELVPGATQIVREQFMLNRGGSPRRTLLDREQGALDKNAFSDHLPVVTRLRRR
jgi:endonuclease/exonuclease/phosphatase family metal-dependent hydrolase